MQNLTIFKMKRIFFILSLSVSFGACKKQEQKPAGKYSASFEIVAPLRNDTSPVFCPAALDLRVDGDAMRRIESQASSEDGLPYSKYIHCRGCNIGVFSATKDSSELLCSYCGAKQPESNQ